MRIKEQRQSETRKGTQKHSGQTNGQNGRQTDKRQTNSLRPKGGRAIELDTQNDRQKGKPTEKQTIR